LLFQPNGTISGERQERMTPTIVFKHCVKAIKRGILVERVSTTDKEYHFQKWFSARLIVTGLNFEIGGRNSYPDFRMVASTEGVGHDHRRSAQAWP
jgi:hypothetical protein